MSEKTFDVDKNSFESDTNHEPMANYTPFPNLSQTHAHLKLSSSSSPCPSASEFSDKYILGRQMGKGTFGTVYICTEKETGNIYACKQISKEFMTNTDHDMVTREIHFMNLLPLHPSIVTLKETFENAETFHLIMDLCTGGELLDRMKRKRRYTEREATIAIRDLAEGIKVCHNNYVIHWDLKPENLMYVEDNDGSTLKIIDFGISITFTSVQLFYNEPVSTLLYSAPEVIQEHYGPESDIWSAGVILYALLSGTLPFYDIEFNFLKNYHLFGIQNVF
ncbi:putative protein kinase CAMK-CDPK family [Helianthus annuus]|nr:putative protein kinase CAMK-CDPK family [Helianthus annuus]